MHTVELKVADCKISTYAEKHQKYSEGDDHDRPHLFTKARHVYAAEKR